MTVGDVSFGAQVLVDLDVHDVDAVLVRRRRAAAGCRAPGRSTATGSGPASRTSPRPACPCRSPCRATGVQRAHRVARADRVDAQRVAAGVGDASCGAAAPTVGASALAFTWNANGSFSPSRSGDAVPDACLVEDEVVDDVDAAVLGQALARAASCRTNCGRLRARRARPRRVPACRDAKPSFAEHREREALRRRATRRGRSTARSGASSRERARRAWSCVGGRRVGPAAAVVAARRTRRA